MAMNTASHQYFDGTDHRFPDFSHLPWFQFHLESAARLAREYRFRCVGAEHILFELLADPAFRDFIQGAGGDPDSCRGMLTRAFREHAQFSFHSEEFGLTDSIRAMLEDFDRFMNGPMGGNADAALSEFFSGLVRAADGSMPATAALEDCGAGVLLLDLDDASFMDPEIDCGFDEDVAIEDPGVCAERPDIGAPVKALREPLADDNPPLDSIRSRIERAHSKYSEAPKPAPTPADSQPEPPQNPEGRKKSQAELRKEEEIAAEVDACLRNLGDKARAGDVDPVMGRDEEIEKILTALRRRRKSSVILVGEAGVGKTAIAEGLAMRLQGPNISPSLSKRPFYELAIQDLVAGTRFRGDYEARIQHLVARLRNENAILFVDEFHMVIGSGSGMSKGMDGANMLKPALGRGEITVIGATTPQEMREMRRDGAMMRRFEVIQVSEPCAEATLRILEGSAQTWLDHHGIEMEDGVLQEICRLMDLYMPERNFPDKAFDLLDMACVACISEDPGLLGMPVLRLKHVFEGSDRLGLRRPHLPTQDEVRKLSGLENILMDLNKGQDEPVRKLATLVKAAALNLNGSAGVRSDVLVRSCASESVERFARNFSSAMGLPFLRLDLSHLRDPSQLWQLVGLPAQNGVDRSGRLVEIADGHQDMVLLIDGVEETAHVIREFIAETMKVGSFRAADGRLISIRGAWVMIRVSGSKEAGASSMGFGRRDGVSEDREALIRRIGAELVDNHDGIIDLNSSAQGLRQEQALNAVGKMIAQIHEMGVEMTVEPAAIDHLSRLTDDRAMRLEIYEQILNPILASIMNGIEAGDGSRRFAVEMDGTTYRILND
jgi:ATP-dependent Clp protease ATP-binding subunit ClpA